MALGSLACRTTVHVDVGMSHFRILGFVDLLVVVVVVVVVVIFTVSVGDRT